MHHMHVYPYHTTSSFNNQPSLNNHIYIILKRWEFYRGSGIVAFGGVAAAACGSDDSVLARFVE